MSELKDKEITVGGRNFSPNTPIIMNLWTFFALIGLMFGVFTYFYNNIKSSNESLKNEIILIRNEQNETTKTLFEVKGQVNTMKQNVDVIVRRSLENDGR